MSTDPPEADGDGEPTSPASAQPTPARAPFWLHPVVAGSAIGLAFIGLILLQHSGSRAPKDLAAAAARDGTYDGTGDDTAKYTDVDWVRHDRSGDVNQRDGAGRTLLMQTIARARREMAEALLARGADVTLADVDGRTALHLACRSMGAEFVSLLLARGADVNARDRKGRTPAHDAAIGRGTDVLRLLEKAGADLHALDAENQTPADLARVVGHSETTDWIERHASTTRVHSSAPASRASSRPSPRSGP